MPRGDGMQVLLRERVANLGGRGEIVIVKDGYARNFLIPKGLAILVKGGEKKTIEIEQKRLQKMAEKERMALSSLAGKLADAAITIYSKANEEGHLFGSVGPKEIAEALTSLVAPVEESAVKMEEHLKSVGEHQVLIRLSPEFEVRVRVTVAAEEQAQ